MNVVSVINNNFLDKTISNIILYKDKLIYFIIRNSRDPETL